MSEIQPGQMVYIMNTGGTVVTTGIIVRIEDHRVLIQTVDIPDASEENEEQEPAIEPCPYCQQMHQVGMIEQCPLHPSRRTPDYLCDLPGWVTRRNIPLQEKAGDEVTEHSR